MSWSSPDIPIDESLSGQYCVNMDGHDSRTHNVSSPARGATVRQRVSSRSEALILGLWAVVGAVFVVVYLRVGVELWAGSRGAFVLGGLVVLAVLFNIQRARTRTVRPRHFNVVEGVAALLLAVGAGMTGQVLGVAGGDEVSMGVAVLAALLLSAPVFGCAVWLAVRAR